jgi:polyisoprenoid-binding protein YceI
MSFRGLLSVSTVVLSLLGMLGLVSAAPAADAYQVDPAHSCVFFRVQHLGVGNTYGRFDDVAGSVVFDEQNPANSSLSIQVKSDSVDTNNAKRDQHLKGPDFFNAKEFPVISFQSKQVRLVKDRTYEVTGELSLHGITRTITVQVQRIGSAKDQWGNYRTGVETSFAIKRSDFDMKFMPGGIGDDVWLLIGIEATHK